METIQSLQNLEDDCEEKILAFERQWQPASQMMIYFGD